MNDKHNKKNNANEALLGIVLLVVIVFFVAFKFFKQEDYVVNESMIKQNETLENISNEEDYKSRVYQEYLYRLENLKKEENFNVEMENKLTTEMTEKVIKETAFDRSDLQVKDSKFSYSKVKYQQNIDRILEEAKKKGLNQEMKIFILQAQSGQFTEDKQTLSLSESDKEYLLVIAKAYEYFASEVYKLQTPTEYLGVANALVNKSYDVATILRKLAIESDPLISTVWFARYAEAVKIFYESKKQN